jgi:hypothetical protein
VVQEPDAGVVLVLLEGHCVVGGGRVRAERRKSSVSDLAKRRDTRGVTRAAEKAPGSWHARGFASSIRNGDVPAKELVTSRRPLRCSPRSTPTTRLSSESSCIRRRRRGDVSWIWCTSG